MKRINITIIISYFLCFYCYAYSINNELWQALINSNKQLAIDLLQQGADINALNEQGLTPIHYFTDLSDEATIKWLYENAQDFGFILRYPKDKQDITKIVYEPWHWRFVGVEAAQEMKKSGQCLEEYLGKVK